MLKSAFPFCVAMGLLGVGALAIYDPKKSAKTYGLPTEDSKTLSFVRACGARDVVVGLGILTKLDRAKPLVLISALIALADFTIISSESDKPDVSSLMIHGGGTVALLIGGLFFTPSGKGSAA